MIKLSVFSIYLSPSIQLQTLPSSLSLSLSLSLFNVLLAFSRSPVLSRPYIGLRYLFLYLFISISASSSPLVRTLSFVSPLIVLVFFPLLLSFALVSSRIFSPRSPLVLIIDRPVLSILSSRRRFPIFPHCPFSVISAVCR